MVKCEDAEKEEVPMFPLGGHYNEVGPNGRDHLEEEDICEAGILLPYIDMWWDTPARAAPQRAICSAVAIADSLDYYYHNKDKRMATAMAARKKAIKEYDWDVCAKRWLKLAKDWEKECA